MVKHRRSYRRRLLGFVRWTVISYLFVVLMIWTFHAGDYLIILPSPGPLAAPNATAFEIPYAHGKLEAFSARYPEKASPQLCVLFFVGNEDRVNPWVYGVAKMWSEQTGLTVEAVGVNLPGFGFSTGPARLDRMAPTGLAAYDACRARLANVPIVVQAASLGTTAALAIGANRPVAALSLQDAPPLRQLVLEYQGRWNLWLLALPVAMRLPDDIDAIANARRVTAPCIFITSGGDTVIPPRFQQRIVDALRGPHEHVTIPGGRHCSQPDETTAPRIAGLRKWLLQEAGLIPKN